jgi:hypothetical protein
MMAGAGEAARAGAVQGEDEVGEVEVGKVYWEGGPREDAEK